MNSFEKLTKSIDVSGSMLCVGLDSDISKLPNGIEKNLDGLLKFNKKIINSCSTYASAFKVNFAFYEQYGSEGFDVLKETMDNMPNDKFIIADSKRGDIGNTSKAYAKSCFEYFNADSITVNPYMGSDSILPFLEYKNKMVFVLALTSNPGSADYQRLIAEDEPIYKHVIKKCAALSENKNIGFVVGATHPDELSEIREIIPDKFLLIPGVGSQGGDIEAILEANKSGPAVINVSRDIIYSSGDQDFAEKAALKARKYKELFNNE